MDTLLKDQEQISKAGETFWTFFVSLVYRKFNGASFNMTEFYEVFNTRDFANRTMDAMREAGIIKLVSGQYCKKGAIYALSNWSPKPKATEYAVNEQTDAGLYIKID